MSERKTTEIKLRVTPDEKARWQFEAEKQGIGLSELIRTTMEREDWVRETVEKWGGVSTHEDSPVATNLPCPRECTCPPDGYCNTPPTVVPTTGEVGSVAEATCPVEGCKGCPDSAWCAELRERLGPVLSPEVTPKPWTYEAKRGV